MRRQVACRFFKQTPGALRYREVDSKDEHIKGDEEGALVGDLYLRKAAIKGRAPDKIKVTIEY
jgi:hypothetical protein